jgi:hypothetical protein
VFESYGAGLVTYLHQDRYGDLVREGMFEWTPATGDGAGGACEEDLAASGV